jgi:hypothetical protein
VSEGTVSDASWRRLREADTSTRYDLGVATIALDVTTRAGAVRLALGGEGEARVLIPVPAGAAFPSIGDSRGILLKDTALTAGGRVIRFIDLSCREPALEDIFGRLTEEIFRRLTGNEAPDAAVEGAVRDFRRLLLRSPTDISLEQALGLCGELVVLEELLAIDPRAWGAWRGPRGARHDFRGGEFAVEVKATLRRARRTFTVSALDQLLAPEGGALMLAWLCFEENPAGAIDAPRLVDRVLARAGDPDGLLGLLETAGYAAEQRQFWERWKFSLLASEGYRVEEGFPRIVPESFAAGSVPPGVARLRYEVDLAMAAPFHLDAPSRREWLQSMSARIGDADAGV